MGILVTELSKELEEYFEDRGRLSKPWMGWRFVCKIGNCRKLPPSKRHPKGRIQNYSCHNADPKNLKRHLEVAHNIW